MNEIHVSHKQAVHILTFMCRQHPSKPPSNVHVPVCVLMEYDIQIYVNLCRQHGHTKVWQCVLMEYDIQIYVNLCRQHGHTKVWQ